MIEKVHIQHAKLHLQLDISITGTGCHTCELCFRELTEKKPVILDDLIVLESHIVKETLFSLMCIAGYVQRSDSFETDDDTATYYQKYGDYVNAVTKGVLQILNYTLVQWSLFCFIFLTQLTETFYSTFCVDKFMFIANKYDFSFSKKQFGVLSNIFLKNMHFYCHQVVIKNHVLRYWNCHEYRIT